MTARANFVEAEGLIHIEHPAQPEFTLCGDAFDLSSDVPGYEQIPTKARIVTCPSCAAIITECRGVRVQQAGGRDE